MKALIYLNLLLALWLPISLAGAERPDERVLWQLFHAQKYRLLRQAIAEYQTRYPNWQPPNALMRLLAAQPPKPKRVSLIERALRQGNLASLRELARRQPKAFDCRNPTALRAVAQAYALAKDESTATRWYRQALNCPKVQAPALLSEAFNVLSPEAFATLLEIAKPRLSAAAYAELSYQNLRRKLLAAAQGQIWPTAEALTLQLQQALKRRDLDLIRAIAWRWYQHGDFAKARDWFSAGLELAPNDESLAEGLLYSSIQLQQEKAVLELGKRYPKLRQAGGGYLLARAWEHYHQGHDRTSQKLAEQVVNWLPEAENARYLLGWLALKRGQFRQAQHIFETLFNAHPDEEKYAQALILSYLQSGVEADELAARFPQPQIQAQLAPHLAQHAFARKQFLRAYRLDRNAFTTLAHLSAPDWGMGAMARFKSGQAGLDRLQLTLLPGYIGSYPLATSQLKLALGRLELASDQLKRAGIRTLQASREALNPSSQALLEQEALKLERDLPGHTVQAAWLELGYRQEGPLNPYFALGLTPIGGPLAPQPTVRFGMSDWQPMRNWQFAWNAEIHRQPVRQSLLSYIGLKQFGESWGQVLRHGVKFSSLLQRGHWHIYQAVEAAFLDGQGTRANWTASYTLAPGYNLPWAGFDYLSLGPYFQFMHYANNQNHFRPGHGGYFSPQAFYAGGMQLALRTQEGKPFLLESRLAAGLQHFREEAAPWFPRRCGAGPLCRLNYPDNQETSFAPSASLRFAWQIHPHLQLAGGVYARKTQGWREASGGLWLRVLFAPGTAVISADLPEALFAAIE